MRRSSRTWTRVATRRSRAVRMFQMAAAVAALATLIGLFPRPAVAASGTITWYSFDPRVISTTAREPTLVHAVTDSATSATIELLNGSTVQMTEVEAGVFEATLTADQVLFGYPIADSMHHFFGSLHLYVDEVETQRIVLAVNVRDATIPDVEVTKLAWDMQKSPHVVNIQSDSLLCLGYCPGSTDVWKRFYHSFTDDYDLVAVLDQVRSPINRTYYAVRNDVQGLGLPLFDNQGKKDFWSKSRLQGVIKYPIDYFFDLGERDAVHEIGHRWMVHPTPDILQPGLPHWPLSDLANGVMGYGPQEGQHFPFTLVEVAPDVFECLLADEKLDFNDLELYLMGLVPESEVSEHYVFQNQDQECFDGGVLLGPVDRFGVQDIVGVDGPRIPGAADSQKDFAIATIVLSQGRLLTGTEMAFFDFMAARGEATEVLSDGNHPFYVATGGRATLSSTLQS